MSVYYITSLVLPAVNANSVQVASTAEAFSRLLSLDFKLVTPSTTNNSSLDFDYWIRIKCWFSKGRFRYLEFAIRILLQDIPAGTVVFTRDVFLAALLCLVGQSVVYESHGRPSWKAKILFRYLFAMPKFRLVCISRALKIYFMGEFGVNERQICVAHDGVFIELYDKVVPNRDLFTKVVGVPENLKIILHTGSLYEGRGAELFDVILDNFESIALVHIGGEEKYLEKWRRKYQGKKFYALSHVRREELVRYQVSSDFLLFPMLRSTPTYWCFSAMKIFEYMATGLPIICSEIGAITEVLDPETAVMFEPDEPKSLIDAVNKILDVGTSKTLGHNAKDRVARDYTWEKRAATIYSFIVEQKL
jgi:glycosyltransferase involved in cell wall biosynthesis